ncbi:MAG: hypothetical protein AAGI38_11510 [Bacteroidota bacterium]
MDLLDRLLAGFANGPFVLTILGISLLAGGYYVWIFKRYYQPGKPSGLPREEPPHQLSPAASRYLWKHGFDLDCLLAGVMSAVVKDCYRIKWREKSFSIFLNKMGSLQKLSGDERAALSFSNRQMIERLGVGKKRNRFTRSAAERMSEYLTNNYRKYLLRVPLLICIGLGVSLLLLLLASFLLTGSEFSIWAFYCLLLIPISVAIGWGIHVAIKIQNIGALMLMVVLALFMLVTIYNVETYAGHFFLPAVLPLIGVHGLAYRFLPRYKPEGFEMQVEIQEFRQFLVQRSNKPRPLDSNEYYLLPYFIALDIPFERQTYFQELLSEEKTQPGMALSAFWGN